MKIINKISNYLVDKKTKISSVIELLQNNPIKLIIVVSKKNQLEGSITDGDVRRGLLNGIDINCNCENIMNAKPRSVINNDFKKIDKLFNEYKIKHPIIINEKNQVTGIVVKKDYTKIESRSNYIVIMAGGEGKRLLPLTLETPKPLLNINNRPIIDTIISRFIKYNFNNIFISLRYKSEKFIKYFSDNKKYNANIKFLIEKKPLGTAGCLSLLNTKDIIEPVIVINGDVLSEINYNQLIDFHLKNKKAITLCVSEYINTIPFGIIKLNKGKISEIHEKPNNKYLINAGIYVINPEVIIKMKKNIKIDMTDLIDTYIEKKLVSVFPIHEQWTDIGTKDDYSKANKK